MLPEPVVCPDPLEEPAVASLHQLYCDEALMPGDQPNDLTYGEEYVHTPAYVPDYAPAPWDFQGGQLMLEAGFVGIPLETRAAICAAYAKFCRTMLKAQKCIV